MEKISAAEEILKYNESQAYFNQKSDYRIKSMIEFAKLHVESALKLITTEATVETINKYSPEEQHIVNQDSILNAYPLENIK
jgi:hypothetical protein